MSSLRLSVRAFLRSESGPTATEYAVLLGIIVVGAIITLGSFGARMNDIYLAIADVVDTVN